MFKNIFYGIILLYSLLAEQSGLAGATSFNLPEFTAVDGAYTLTEIHSGTKDVKSSKAVNLYGFRQFQSEIRSFVLRPYFPQDMAFLSGSVLHFNQVAFQYDEIYSLLREVSCLSEFSGTSPPVFVG